MVYHARVTIHQSGIQRPDYSQLHAAMQKIGFSQRFLQSGEVLHTLGGMYVSIPTLDTMDAVDGLLNSALGALLGHHFSYELDQVTDQRTGNLRLSLPVPQGRVSNALSSIGQPVSKLSDLLYRKI